MPHPGSTLENLANVGTRQVTAWAAVRDARQAAAPFGVRVLVFGSLAEGGFHAESDLDLALDGPLDALRQADLPVWRAVDAHRLPCDVVWLPTAPRSLRDRIEGRTMPKTPWDDVARELAAARELAEKAAAKHARLDGLDDEARENAELAIGRHIHDATTAAERAIERLLRLTDGSIPGGARSHLDLLDQAAAAAAGRAPLIGPATHAALTALVKFRHVYRNVYTFDYALAAPNVRLACETLPRLAAELEATAGAIGLPAGDA